MARTFNEEDYTLRRNEILDVAQRLIYTKGYEQMTIQDILDALKISKGAFYHYFDSKPAMLEALIDRMIDSAVQMLQTLIQGTDLPTVEKLRRFIDAGMTWKTAQKDFFLPLLRIWYTDDNAIVRQKVTASGLKQLEPLLSEIIRQGGREGIFSTPLIDYVGEVVLTLLSTMSERMAQQILAFNAQPAALPLENCLDQLRSTAAVYTDALERVLGAPAHSLNIIDVNLLKPWLPEVSPAPEADVN